MISHIAIRNTSRLFPQWRQWKPMIEAINLQLRRDVGPTLGVVPPTIDYYETTPTVTSNAFLIHIIDDPDDDAYGYHHQLADGTEYAKVFVKPTLEHGGTLILGPSSVSMTLSHEIIESIGNPNCNLLAKNYATGFLVPYELCDPDESCDDYAVNGVQVSNFVTDEWFDCFASPAEQFDFRHRIRAPFQVMEGGYCNLIGPNGARTQAYGDAYPAWKKSLKQSHGRVNTRILCQISESSNTENTEPERYMPSSRVRRTG